MIFALMTVIFFASRPIFIFTKFYCTAAAHHHRQSTATIEEEDQQRAKTQFSIDSKHLLQLDSQLLCLCALIQYFSPFFCLCALIQPHHRCTAVQSTRPPAAVLREEVVVRLMNLDSVLELKFDNIICYVMLCDVCVCVSLPRNLLCYVM
ncbi:unnamed protein product [Camellia sinensis]